MALPGSLGPIGHSIILPGCAEYRTRRQKKCKYNNALVLVHQVHRNNHSLSFSPNPLHAKGSCFYTVGENMPPALLVPTPNGVPDYINFSRSPRGRGVATNGGGLCAGPQGGRPGPNGISPNCWNSWFNNSSSMSFGSPIWVT